MKAIIGSAIGVLAIGLILIGASLRGSAAPSTATLAPNSATMPNAQNVVPVGYAGAASAASGPVMVNCAPGQRALVRQVVMNGEPVSQVACVADMAGVTTDGYAQARPVSYTSTANAYDSTRSSNLTERRVVYQQPTAARVVRKERSSWKKPLLVIGGSTAAGAGIGGLVGGKKGALIGAALGGGASTLYEATRK